MPEPAIWNTILRAVIYCRVSEDKQNGRSVAEQEAECRADCKRNGWAVAEVVVDNSVGASRWSKGTREGYGRLDSLLRPGDILITWEASRAQRDLDAYVKLRKLCADRGVLWRYSGRTYDLSDGHDRFSTGLDALLAEKSSEETRDRVRRTNKHSAARGELHGGPTPFGYKRTGVRQMEPDPVTAPLIAEAAQKILARESLRSIAADWNERGYTRLAGKPWTGRLVGRTLSRAIYAGKRVHHGRVIEQDGNWEPLISWDTHRRVVAILSDPSRIKHRGVEVRHLLTGIAVCGICGGPVDYIDRTTSAPQYRCAQKGCVSIRVEWVEEHVMSHVMKLFADIAADKFLLDDQTSPIRHREEAEKLNARLEELTDAAVRGEVSVQMLGNIERQLLAQIDEHLRQSEGPDPLLNALLTDPYGLWGGAGIKERRAIIRRHFAITLNPPGRGARTFKPESVVVVRKG